MTSLSEIRKLSELITARPICGTNIPGSFSFGSGNLLVYLDSDSSLGDFRFLACMNLDTLQKRDLLKPEPGAGDTEENLSLEEKLRRERQRAQSIGVTSFSWFGSRGLLIPLHGCVYLLNPREEKPTLNLLIAKDTLPVIDARSAPPTHPFPRIAYVRGGDLYVFQCTDLLPNGTAVNAQTVLVSYPPANNEPGRSNGLASFLAQEEMDRQHGYWWSPGGTFIAYERVDERNVPNYSIIHQSDKILQEDHRYPFAGAPNPKTELCVTNVNNRFLGDANACHVLDLTMSTGETDIYLGRVDWYSETYLFVQLLNREQTRLELYSYDVSQSPIKKRLLIEETSPYWINLHDLYDNLDHHNRFLWGSERSGFLHLYLYEFNPVGEGRAQLIHQITGGDFICEIVVGIDETNDLVYFMGNAGDPTERHLYVARLTGDKPGVVGNSTVPPPFMRLTKPGTNYVTFDSKSHRFVLNNSTLEKLPVVTLEELPDVAEIHRVLNETKMNLTNAATYVASSSPTSSPVLHSNSKRLKSGGGDPAVDGHSSSLGAMSTAVSLRPLPPFTKSSASTSPALRPMTPAEDFLGMLHRISGITDLNCLPPFLERPPAQFTFHVEKQVSLHAHVFIPPENKFGKGPFPTVVYVYGGPHVQRIKNDWYSTMDLRSQALSSLGYLVVKCDNRGSSRRGIEFESPIHHRMGTVELEDQIFCLKRLAEINLCDINRVGITGWSYGGYLSAMALCKFPDVFKVGVAGAPVTSWDGYDTAYTERYMGTPQSNPEGYADGSVMTHASKLKGKLMLVHGMVDENVHFRHTARLVDALIQQCKPHDLLILPDERHGPRKMQSRQYLEQRTIQYFIDNL